MTDEQKQILIKDICARLPYGVKIEKTYVDYPTALHEEDIVSWKIGEIKIKPYLRPMSSMTEEERGEFCGVGGVMSYSPQHDSWAISAFAPEAYDWLNSHHFDFRGLIEKGLAIEASEGMYKFE